MACDNQSPVSGPKHTMVSILKINKNTKQKNHYWRSHIAHFSQGPSEKAPLTEDGDKKVRGK